MSIKSRLKSLARGHVGGYALSDLALAAIGQPSLLYRAARYVIRRRGRMVESGVKAATNKKIRKAGTAEFLSTTELVNQLSKELGVLVMKDDGMDAVIGVSDVDFISALIFLRMRAQNPAFRIGRAKVNLGMADFKRRALKAKQVRLNYSGPDLQPCSIRLEPFFRHDSGIWLSNNTANSQIRAIREECFEEPSLRYAEEFLQGRTARELAANRKIDVVYTWVDHSDPDWAEMYSSASGQASLKTDAASMTRFHNNDELKFSLRSVWLNAKWVNKIYIVSNCRPPAWLKLDDDRVIWVDHREILADEHLPTFNSHAIESALHRIPGLAEHFLYINDDVFFARPLSSGFFFDISGASMSFLEGYGMVSGPINEGDPDYLNASRNSSALLNAAFGYVATQLHQHTIFALRKSTLQALEERWPEEFAELRRCQFRTPADLNCTSFLYHHYGLWTGEARIGSIKNAFVKSSDIRWRSKLNAIETTAFDTFCINEGGVDDPPQGWHQTVNAFLKARLPEKAPWEH